MEFNGLQRQKLSKYLAQIFTSHGNEMICQPVTLSGYTEWPKVADAVIEAQQSLRILAPIGYAKESPMLTIHVSQYGRTYFIDGLYWGDNQEEVIMYLTAKGVLLDNIAKTLEGLAQAGGYMIRQEQ